MNEKKVLECLDILWNNSNIKKLYPEKKEFIDYLASTLKEKAEQEEKGCYYSHYVEYTKEYHQLSLNLNNNEEFKSLYHLFFEIPRNSLYMYLMEEKELKFENRSGKAVEIVIDSKGEPYSPSNNKILINKEKKEQLKAIVNAAVYIDNYYSIFIRNVFRDAHNNFKKRLFRQIKIIDKNDYNFLFYVSDCLHNVPEIIMASLRIIDCEENEIVGIPFIYPLLQREIKCLKNVINLNNNKTREEMKIKDNNHIVYYIRELNRMDAAIDELLMNIQKFMEGESL